MTLAAQILPRLERVKPAGKGHWMARCPAHQDRSPSLSISEREGRLLVHCFGGCDVLSVLQAVGLDYAALYPPRESSGRPLLGGTGIPAHVALRCLHDEAVLILVAGRAVADGKKLDDASLRRLSAAISRIDEAISLTTYA